MSMKDEITKAKNLIEQTRQILSECILNYEDLINQIAPEDCPCISETFDMAKNLCIIAKNDDINCWFKYCKENYQHLYDGYLDNLFEYPIDKFIEFMIWDAILTFCSKNEGLANKINFIEKYFPKASGQYWYIDNKELSEALGNDDEELTVDFLREKKTDTKCNSN